MRIIKQMTMAETAQVAKISAEAFSQPWSKQSLEESLAGTDSFFLVCMENNQVLGYCGLYMAADEGEIVSVAVSEMHRGKGIAYALMQELLAKGRALGISRFFLEVRVSNTAAIALYEKSGFTRQGIRRNFYQAPVEDACVMNRIYEY